MTQKASITFLGAAGTVTGSKYLVEFAGKRILVDCGLFQGKKELRLKNWTEFPIEANSIDAIVLTHAHIDHSGFIPRLVKEGFRGPIFCTPATLSLCRILLPDTGHLQEEEAKFLNKRKLSKHDPALPLFSKREAELALDYFLPRDFGKEFEILAQFKCEFLYAGHILGASQVVLSIGDKRIGFSGDLGRQEDPILYPPVPMKEVDYLLVESTYGDRLHPVLDPIVQLESVINETAKNRGVVLIPAFTVGRAQYLMYLLAILKREGRVPSIPIYLNSPMATNVTDVFCDFRPLHKLTPEECKATCSVVEYVKDIEESKRLNERHGPMVIISASGMATGGRILHHLLAFASEPQNHILLAGYQAVGTRGRSLQEGAKYIKVFRQMVPVRARVTSMENASGHADYREIIQWLEQSHIQPKKVFIVHGEVDAANSLKTKLEERFKWACEIPSQDQTFEFEVGT